MLDREFRDLAYVPRWGIIRNIKQQNVAEHSFFVALYTEQLARIFEWQGDLGRLLTYALQHDVEESFTSDIPGPIKKWFVDKEKEQLMVNRGINARFIDSYWNIKFEEIPADYKALVKMADSLDEMFYLASEIQMGNGAVHAVFQARQELARDYLYKVGEEVFGFSAERVAQIWTNIIAPAIHKHLNENSRVVR